MTPSLIRWIYSCTLVLVVVSVLFGLLWVWALASWMGAAMWLAAPIVIGAGLITLLVVRVACERMISRFRQPQFPMPQPSAYRSPPRQPGHR
ncbi:hypothetical protein K1Y72_22250 [Actinomadura sp. PM05-2]|uniref:DUF4175 domain-containing protein n=1 Tax=Actinomadura parmotrematis TaxID=2864039 RepID=A0ABS7FXH4_9ACTN|nr:hypothetical protein [Actinomadura parmotrematis]